MQITENFSSAIINGRENNRAISLKEQDSLGIILEFQTQLEYYITLKA